MRDITLKEVTFNGLRHAVVNRRGEVVDTLTQREFDALQAVDGKPPARIQVAWYANQVAVFGGSPDYGNGTAGLLSEGEVCERADHFEVGYAQKVREGLFRRAKLRIPKTAVQVDRTGGLTLTKQRADAWDDAKTGVLAIENGVLRVAE